MKNTVSLSQQVIIVKSMLDLLNEKFPVPEKGIPATGYKDKVFVHFESIRSPYYTAHQMMSRSSVNNLPIWCINSHDYHSWKSNECQKLIEAFNQIGLENGFNVILGYQHIVGKAWFQHITKEKKLIFIGKIDSKITYL